MKTGHISLNKRNAFIALKNNGINFLGKNVSSISVLRTHYGMAGKSASMPASTASAAVSTIGFLGFLIGPPIIGFIAQVISLRWSFSLVALIGFGTTLLAGKLKT